MNEEELRQIKQYPVDEKAMAHGDPDWSILLCQIQADIARQLTIANEIATRRHQIEYALAFQKNNKINYEVDPPIDIPTPAPDANIRLEILAKAFLHDTGIVSPHEIQTVKDGSPGHSFEERQDAWRKWLKENDVPVPTPDIPATSALVEAVKYVIHRYIPGDSMMDLPITKLKNALADHKKAVT